MEGVTEDSEHQSLKGRIDPAVHGKNGPLAVTVPDRELAINPMIIKATQELKEFPFTLDFNNGRAIGTGG